MAMVLKAGARFRSAVCDAQVMVVKAPPGEHELHCGGAAMLGGSAPAPEGLSLDSARAGGTLIGKRYVNQDESLELLATKGGKGTLALDGMALDVKQAKQLPSSD
ncbi:MAG: hypothetical protein JWQ90_4979 [Hydrocarboniphaga sp.]|uniref:hypothetical protein n=1 Tax=Hydrocarboniphaga sp. TaxID=2033016 RepID=UPI002616AA11|nr:hypothetical protein [Hydrocarboniphaga sp.]MDB5972529.1 hypothetical protein [Hydrocarboniphaga sp.]